MRVIGFAFLSAKTVQYLNIHGLGKPPEVKTDVKTFTGDVPEFNTWVRSRVKAGVTPIAVLEDRALFRAMQSTKCERGIVVQADYEWLVKRDIPCLDASPERVDGKLMISVRRTTPAEIWEQLLSNETPEHKLSETDRWLQRSSTQDLCAGCSTMSLCESTPTSTRECGDGRKYERDVNERTAYKRYSLGQLVYTALHACDERLLMIEPKTVWVETFKFALGQTQKSVWIANYGRPLKTAGAAKPVLKSIVRWVAAFGSVLSEKRVENPPSKGDVKFAARIADASR